VCFFHLLGFLLIDIETLILVEDRPHPPVEVTPYIGNVIHTEGKLSAAQIDAHGLLPRYILEPEAALPKLPKFPDIPVLIRLPHEKDLSSSSGMFQQVERVAYRYAPLSMPLKFNTESVGINVSGLLWDFELKPYELNKDSLDNLPENIKGNYRCTFRVQVQEKTGEIFWYSLNKGSSVDLLDHIAEEYIKELVFETPRTSSISEGEIEIVFSI